MIFMIFISINLSIRYWTFW